MKAILSLIIFADGAGALIGALVTARLRSGNRWPALARIITLLLGGYAIARFGIAWNTATHGAEIINCVSVQSPAYIRNYTAFASLQAVGVWAAVLMLIASVMNGSLKNSLAAVRRCLGGLWKRKKAD